MAAKNYTEILALVNAGNQMGLSNTIKRDYGIPLDFTSVQPSFDDAVIYAAENTKAYVGQPLSVGGKLYIINDVAAAEKHVVGEKEYDNYLVEVGSATEGDGVTIDLEEGVLTLHGFDSALTGYLPRKSEDGSLEWVPISAVVQGDGNKVTTLTSEDGSVTITKKTDTDESLVYDLSVEAYDDSDLQDRVKAIEDDYLKAEDKYDDSDLQTRVKAIEDDYLKAEDKYDDTDLQDRVKALEEEERYDETPLANRVTDLETAVGNAESGLVKGLADEVARAQEAERLIGERIDGIDFVDETELATALEPYAKTADVNTALADKADKSALEELKGTVDAFLTGDGTEAALDSLKELIAYIESHDDVDIAGIIEDIEAIEGKLEGVESTVVDYVTAAIDALKIGDYAKADELADLAETVAELVAKPFDTYATKSEVEGVDAKFANYTTTETLATQLAAKADADKVVSNDTFETFKGENTDAINAARAGAVADVAEVGYALADNVASTYATKQSVTDLGNTIDTKLNDYAKTEDVEADLAKKVDAATIAHATEETAEGATVNGTTLNIVVDAFTKAETRQYVADTISQMTGGESAADVLLALNNYKSDNDERVGAIETKNNEQDTAISAAQTQADKGVADAKAANDAISALTTGTVATHTSDISAIKGRLDTLETAKGNHETRISAAEGEINALKASDETINATLGTITGQITTLTNKDAELAGLITALQSDKADKSVTYTKTETDKAIADAVAGADLSQYAKVTDVEAIFKAGEGEAAATGILAVEIERAKAAEKANADAITALVGEDSGKTIRAIAAEETAAIVAGADAKYDTLKEIADFIMNDETGAAAMANDIAALKTTVGDAESGLVKAVADNAAAIAAIVQPNASTEISVATDGTLGINEMNVNKLVQTDGDTLVLNGGAAK